MQAESKYDTTITSRYSSVISENNGCIGHKYKLSIDYKGTMKRQEMRTEQAEVSSLYKKGKSFHKLKNRLVMRRSSSHSSIHYITTLHYTTLYY
jgi:guanylate kinase